jgi:hypothetical protein
LNILKRKKSKTHKNFVKLSRLSTKLSLEELEAMQIGQQPPNSSELNQKLNHIGKMLGNKLFSMVKPISQTGALILPHSLSLPQQLSSFMNLDSKTATNEKSSDIDVVPEVVENQPQLVNLLIMESKEAEGETVKPAASSTTNKLSASSNINSASSSSSISSYIPRVNQKQYSNRLDKLNDVNRLVVKSSQTRFIFI